MNGRAVFHMDGTFEIIPEEAMTMGSPVRCTYCGAIYDLQAVEVKMRHADCSVWDAPCCGHRADSREDLSLPSYRRIAT